ncbi:MAG: hypothetical protein ACO3K7_01315 [Candidatus Marinamargulisbacteria bacterium]
MPLFKRISRKKVITCTACQSQFRLPIKSGKTLRVKCPHCRAQYTVSFVNPLTQLMNRSWSWGDLTPSEKWQWWGLRIILWMIIGMMASFVLDILGRL